MQSHRSKRSRQRAAKPTRGYGAKKKHRGSGHRGGVGLSSIGKRSSAKKMKITKGDKHYLGKYGFKTLNKKVEAINLQDIQERLNTFVLTGNAVKDKDAYVINIKEKAEDNKANIELIRFLSKELNKKVRIKSGLKSKIKILEAL